MNGMNNLSDRDRHFLQAFEQDTLPHFSHRDHIYMAWLYLRADGWEEGYRKISDGLRQMSAAHGVPDKYHETITRFWAQLVYHALQQTPEITDFDVFADQFPVLFDSRAISQHYSP